MDTKITAAALAAIKGAIKRDRDHKIRINETYTAGRFAADTCVKDFHCPDYEIKNRVLTVFATGDRAPIIDGATFAPDKIGPLDIAPGYIVHDLMYEYLEPMAEAWGVEVEEVRKIADIALGQSIMQTAGKSGNPIFSACGSFVAKIYYRAVRLVGGIFHSIGKLFHCFLAAAAIGGIAAAGGCQVPDGYDIQDIPNYDAVPAASAMAQSPASGLEVMA